MKSLKTPLRYPGGKSRACTKMECYFPDLREYREYREPFIGGGSVALFIAKKFPNVEIWVNDLYEPLINFWKQLQWNGDLLASRLIQLKGEYPDPTDEQKKDTEFKYPALKLFEQSKDIINDYEYDSADRAVAFYVVNKCSFSGLTESSSFSKMASISNFSLRGIEKLPKYQEIIENWKITNESYEDLLTDWRGTFVYLDPPYDIKDNLYGKKGEMHKKFDHDKFAHECDRFACDQLISYNSNQLVKDRFKGWNAGEFDLTYTMRSVGDYMMDQEKRKELLLFNYNLTTIHG
jgi:DNA adenine methylase